MPAAHPFLLIAVVLVVVVLGFEAISTKLDVPPWALALIFAASYLGSRINIPLWRSSSLLRSGQHFQLGHWIFYHPPVVADQVVAVNVGGAIIPVLFSIWLLPRAPLLRTLLATIVVAAVTHIAATPVPGAGIEMPIWLAPLVAAGLGLVLTLGKGAAPLAYIAGSLGTLIGADLTNLGRLGDFGPGVLSIGGAGVFDGVFLTGIVAVLLSFERPRRPKYTRQATS